MATATKKAKLTRESLVFTGPQQRELMRIVLEAFDEFAKRKQHYYDLMGMSTSHIVVHAIADDVTLNTFWPSELVQYDPRHGTIYQKRPGVMREVQSAIRPVLDQLANKGYLDKVGNEHERRYRPVRDIRPSFAS